MKLGHLSPQFQDSCLSSRHQRRILEFASKRATASEATLHNKVPISGMKASHTRSTRTSQRNRYVMVDLNPRDEIDLFSSPRCEWGEGGRLFYLDVCRCIETISEISGLTFYISARTPSHLPRYGHDVVQLLLADELYAHRAYHHRLLAIFRCLPARPIYLEGIPTSAKHLSYLAHYGYKYCQYAKGLLSIVGNKELPHIHKSTTRTMMIPLGCFAHFEPAVIPMGDRDFDYAFLGSVTYNANEKKWFHAVMQSPKEFARRVMCESYERYHLAVDDADFFIQQMI